MKSSRVDCYESEQAWFSTVPENYHLRPDFTFVQRDKRLPDLLLIGDSISMSYTVGVQTRLKGMANVFRAPDNCRSTRQILENIETYLGNIEWDVIHFNAGIHDLTWMDSERHTTDIGVGNRQIPPEAYRPNLEAITDRFLEAGTGIIWATTTPIQPGTPHRDPEDAIAYNRIAAEIMSKRTVTIDDLYSVAEPRLTELQPPQNVHFTEVGADVLADAVASSIRSVISR